MSKKKRKRNNCCDLPNYTGSECGNDIPPMCDPNSPLSKYIRAVYNSEEPSINTRMRIFGNLHWLSTETQGGFVNLFYSWGYFQRIVIGSEYQFPEHTMTGLN